ncbi:MAG TPA: hypothetical protein VFC90_02915 [Planctomycetota bacterium]|nr:hypothetical protein [Planctomycetota bacterium]
MNSLIRALAKLPRRRLRLLIRAGGVEAGVQILERRLAAVRKDKTALDAKEGRLERRLAAAERKLSALLAGAGSAGRGPGRPPKRRGPGRPPKRRGPGRPPKAAGRRGRRRANAKPLAQVLRDVLSKKSQPMSVSELATSARDNGYRTKSKPQVFAITVSLALRKRTDLFTRNGKKYELAKGAAQAD